MARNNDNILEKYHLTEAHKRMKQLFEYSFYHGTHEGLGEADDDDEGQQGGDPMGGGMPGGEQPGGEMPGGGEQPGDNMPGGGNPMGDGMPGGEQPGGNIPGGGGPMGGGMPGGGEQPGGEMPGGDIPGGGAATGGGMPGEGEQAGGEMPEDVPTEEDVPMDDEGNLMDDEGDTDEMQPGDEVIDVDELTDAQEETDHKITGVDKKLGNLVKIMGKYIEALELSNKKIESLKAEIERRNPTDEEKLNIRSLSSNPFTENPKDFWRKKQAERPNYNVIYDNDIPANEEEEEFAIRRSDLNDDDRNIMKSFSIDEPQRLKNVLSF